MADITMETLYNEITALRSEMKSLAKITRKVRATQEDPTGEKAAERSKNNGFNRLNEVDSALREFLSLAEGEMISRSDATRRVNQYVKENGLKHPDNARVVIMDDKLRGLLNPPEDVQVTVLTIQKYLSPHFIKKDAPVVAKAEVKVEAEVEAAAPVETPKETVKKMVKRPVVRKVVEA